MRIARACAVTATLLALAVTGCSASDASQPSVSTSSATAGAAGAGGAIAGAAPLGAPEEIAADLSAPWSVTFIGSAALVSERDSGRILELLGNGNIREVATVQGVGHGGEGGLLGIVADAQRRLFVYSTAADGNRIERYDVLGEPGALSLGEPTVLVDAIPAAGYHNGGRLALGPDGMLYATTGDAGRRGAAQDPSSLAGKILRMNADGAVPADNPFPGSLVFSYGHRNPQGITWDADGTMYATEFGQDTWDELNVITAGGNYGWPASEGITGADGFIDPIQQWDPEQASPSGAVAAEASVFIANLRGQVLRVVPTQDTSSSTELFAGEYGRLRDVVLAPDGSLWVLTSNTDGRGDDRRGDDRILRLPLGT